MLRGFAKHTAVLGIIVFMFINKGSLKRNDSRTDQSTAKLPNSKYVKRVDRPSSECHCGTQEISCIGQNCLCVSLSVVCDGHSNCPRGDDELNCEYPREGCPNGFLCTNGKCVERDLLCDAIDDCGDGSDEELCDIPHYEGNCTAPNTFNCTTSGYCIPMKWVCDGDYDCHDKSDENCSMPCEEGRQFRCEDGQCIYKWWVCDGEPDCGDASDERKCENKPLKECQEGEKLCHSPGRCVSQQVFCDGHNDCGDWSDEMDCNSTSSCSNQEFRCASGKCIDMGLICNGLPDCDSGEEEEGCPNSEEEASESFPDCMTDKWRCDGEADCPHAEDETNCDDGIHCTEDFFQCASNCVEWHQVCDGHQDCIDGEDEVNCEATTCSKLQCSYACVRDEQGNENCICQKGMTLQADNITCAYVNECQSFYPCSQKCDDSKEKYKCSCVRGYALRTDGTTCKALGHPPTLIFANRRDIRQISLDSHAYSPLVVNLQSAIAVDYHYRRSLLFWTDYSLRAIFVANLNGSDQNDIIRWGLKEPSGLAVDWIHDHIYWVDQQLSRIEVAELDGRHRRPLVWEDVGQPRAIAVHPLKRLIIWTDWGKTPKIEKAFMDGSGRVPVVDRGVFWINGLTIDYPTDTVYWVDAKKYSIEAVSLDGTERRKINRNLVRHPFSVTVFEENLYWTDWNTGGIHRMDKRNGGNLGVVHAGMEFPMAIQSLHQERQPLIPVGERRGCAWRNGLCSHLCLPGEKGHTCFCPYGLMLTEDRRSCSTELDKLLIYAQGSNLRMISLQETGVLDSTKRADNILDTVLPVDDTQQVMAVDFLAADDMIYWSDIEKKSISRAHLNGTGQEVLVKHNLEMPAGLAVDWVNRKLYWTDDGGNNIEVSNLDGSNRAVLIWQGLHNPRDIVVDPSVGLMFWTEWGTQPRIERAGMDGSGRSIIISTNLTWPNGLAIDFDEKHLYWLDAGSNFIEFANLDGTNRRVVRSDSDQHHFGLTLYKDRIFWSDWKTLSIYVADKKAGNNVKAIVTNLKKLMDVRVFTKDQAKLKVRNPCENNNGGCSHLCLLKPGGYSCACPTGIVINEDKKTCASMPREYLLIAHKSVIKMLSLDTPYLSDTVLPLPRLSVAAALDIDPVTGEIFFSDSDSGIIYRSSPDGTNVIPVISSATGNIEGLSLDSSGKKIYWTDFKRNSLEVAETDGSYRKVLFTDLGNPRAVITHYKRGNIFWTDWNESSPRIETADMDGQGRKVLVDSNVIWPNGLSIDWKNEELYWTDAKLGNIQAIGLDGKDRRVVINGQASSHPYGVSLLGTWVYWTDWQTKALQRAPITSGKPISSVISGLDGARDVKAMPKPFPDKSVCGSDNGGCSQLCLRNPNGHSCTCSTGLHLKGSLSRISLDVKTVWDVPLQIPGINNPIAVDVLYRNNLLFYTDTVSDSIRSLRLDNLKEQRTIVTDELNTPVSLAVDWIAENLYWTDPGRQVIEVAKIDGSARRRIVDSDIKEPRDVAVFPMEGYMFWTDWGNTSKIERAYLDGSNRTVLISTNLGWPNGLAIDYTNQRLYWTDAKRGCLETSDLNGERRVQLLKGLRHPFGLTLFENYVYWTDWESMSVEKALKSSGQSHETIRDFIQHPMQIVAVGPHIQTGMNPCGFRNGGCSHLCFFRKAAGRVCACPDLQDENECSEEPLFDVGDADVMEGGSRMKTSQKEEEDQSSSGGYLGLISVLLLGVILVVGALYMTITWLRKREFKPSETQTNALTYTNPTYSASHLDVAMDRKQFTWRRHEHQQVKMFEERGEVAALISEGSSVEHDTPPSTPPQRLDIITSISA